MSATGNMQSPGRGVPASSSESWASILSSSCSLAGAWLAQVPRLCECAIHRAEPGHDRGSWQSWVSVAHAARGLAPPEVRGRRRGRRPAHLVGKRVTVLEEVTADSGRSETRRRRSESAQLERGLRDPWLPDHRHPLSRSAAPASHHSSLLRRSNGRCNRSGIVVLPRPAVQWSRRLIAKTVRIVPQRRSHSRVVERDWVGYSRTLSAGLHPGAIRRPGDVKLDLRERVGDDSTTRPVITEDNLVVSIGSVICSRSPTRKPAASRIRNCSGARDG